MHSITTPKIYNYQKSRVNQLDTKTRFIFWSMPLAECLFWWIVVIKCQIYSNDVYHTFIVKSNNYWILYGFTFVLKINGRNTCSKYNCFSWLEGRTKYNLQIRSRIQFTKCWEVNFNYLWIIAIIIQ